jgi:hypothetical protein
MIALRVHPARRSVLPFAMLIGAACASPRTATRTEAAPDVRSLEGTVSVLATADSKGCRDRACIQEDAVRAVLFVGVPGSRIPKAMVPNEQEAVRDHRTFFTDLLEKKGYDRFIVRVSEATSTSATHVEEKAWNVVINTDALRRALEEAGVIRRFGY